MDESEFVRLVAEAEQDQAAQRHREALCVALKNSFMESGRLLWVGGDMIGPDRVEGRSPFRFGSDATVGLATVSQIAGELTAGVISLLYSGNSYPACALLRQMVEVEYLAWAFAEDEEEAANWLRSSSEDRRRRWRPHRLRERSGGRFRGKDYERHCELGGHPTPEAWALLPHHSAALHVSWWWMDLPMHGVSTWDYLLTASGRPRYQYREHLEAVAEEHGLPVAAASWRQSDTLARLPLPLPETGAG